MTIQKHLPNLNSLRFIAASLVIFGHVDLALNSNGYTPALSKNPVFNFHIISVILFFVLSGFLITYLLLKEKAKREIAVKEFYLKRVLRIWPLYFLVVILAFSFFNYNSFFTWHELTDTMNVSHYPKLSVVLLLLISPNVLLLFSHVIGYVTPTWSIGVEEQFYLIWPWIMKSKNPVFFILAIILGIHLLNNGILISVTDHLETSSHITHALIKISAFFTKDFSFRIDSMAIGALGAFAAHSNSSILPTIFSRRFQYLLYTLMAFMFCSMINVSYQFYSLVFILIILNLAINPSSVVTIENRTFSYLGKISFGIYMYHMFTIMPVIHLVIDQLKFRVNLVSELLICLISLIATIIIASISYRFFESYFLRLKGTSRFSRT